MQERHKTFFPRQELYQGDFDGMMRSPGREFEAGFHFHDFYEIQFYPEGSGRIRSGEQEYPVSAGDVAVINMFELHGYVPEKGKFYQRFAVSLDPGFLLAACSGQTNLLALFHRPAEDPPVFHVGGEAFERCRHLIEVYENPPVEFGKDVYRRAVLYMLLAVLFDQKHPWEAAAAIPTAQAETVTRLICYIGEHLEEELDLTGLADYAHFSTSYLCRLFRRYTGTTLKQYINLKRVERAKALLKGGATAREASLKAGFNNYSYFYKTFKNIAGMGPAEYGRLGERSK